MKYKAYYKDIKDIKRINYNTVKGNIYLDWSL